jgi:hypothetical protein
MKGYALLLVVAALGCLCGGGQKQETTSTTSLETTYTTTTQYTTTLTQSPTTSSTATTLPVLQECDDLKATFWKALCLDDAAYRTSDERLCHTIYCKARFEGFEVCDDLYIDNPGWRSFQQRACEAWANKTIYGCRGILDSSSCIRWYTLLANNFTYCDSIESRGGENCAWDFAYWRGNMSVCDKFKTVGNIYACEANYYMMLAQDSADPNLCKAIRVPRVAGECRDAANWTGPQEKHPLYGARMQLLG